MKQEAIKENNLKGRIIQKITDLANDTTRIVNQFNEHTLWLELSRDNGCDIKF